MALIVGSVRPSLELGKVVSVLNGILIGLFLLENNLNHRRQPSSTLEED